MKDIIPRTRELNHMNMLQVMNAAYKVIVNDIGADTPAGIELRAIISTLWMHIDRGQGGQGGHTSK